MLIKMWISNLVIIIPPCQKRIKQAENAYLVTQYIVKKNFGFQYVEVQKSLYLWALLDFFLDLANKYLYNENAVHHTEQKMARRRDCL